MTVKRNAKRIRTPHSRPQYVPIREEAIWLGSGYVYPFRDRKGRRVCMCLNDFRSFGLSHPMACPNQ